MTKDADTHLDGVEPFLFLRPVPLVCKTDDGGSTLPNSHLLAYAVLLKQANGARAGLRTSAFFRIGLLAAGGRARGRLAGELGRAEEVPESELLASRVGMDRWRPLAGYFVFSGGRSR